MARGRKKALTLEEQLANTISQIEETEERLEELKDKKDELEGQLKMNRIAELDDLITSHGLSIEDVKEMLEKN